MNPPNYSPINAWEVALALGLFDFGDERDLFGEDIAQDMLDGAVKFTREELEKLAAFKGVTVEYLTENDLNFRAYADPVTEVRKAIAAKLVRSGADAEFAAEICGLDVERVKMLK